MANRKMNVKLLLYMTLSLWIMRTLVFAIRLSKPDCPESCGNVKIPFPFGIGQECSANSSFTIDCRNFTKPETPFLSSLDLEVLAVDLTEGQVVVNQLVSPINCSSEEKNLSLGKPLLGTPFIFSKFYNVLMVLGCKNVVSLVTNNKIAGGCMAICESSGYNLTDTDCNGLGCCKTDIPRQLKDQQIIYKNTDTSTGSFCGYAFLVEDYWFRNNSWKYKGLQKNLSNPFDKEFLHAPVALDWEFPKADLELGECNSRLPNYYDGTIDYIYSYGITCQCKYGFQGNPYLEDGCQDIDECMDPTLNHCGNGTCINAVGYYRCQKGKKSRVKMALIGIGAGLGALVLLVGAWRSYKVIEKRIKANRKQKLFKRNGGLLLEQQLSSTQNGVERTKLFSSKELEHATDHFNVNRILGRGGQGTVYKGMLSDGRIVAVKKSQKVDEDDLEVFINEVVILSQINHRNVVKLQGCCLETEVPLLVYEFIPNDTLFQHIHNPTEEFPLTWGKRLRIATEVASALSYLHYAASLPIYHRDIKSTNILLDDKYRAKVSDFGTSRSVAIDQTHLTTKVIGTFGYLDPEYFQSSQFTEKSDVYSFGVVMVELLTGQKAISSIRSQDQGKSLATNFLQAMEENCLHDILDAGVLNEDTKEEIMATAQLARRCLYLNGKRRPTMKEVAVELEAIQMSKQGSSLQDNLGDTEHHSIIEVSKVYDFASISGSINFDNITISSTSDVDPLLFATS